MGALQVAISQLRHFPILQANVVFTFEPALHNSAILMQILTSTASIME